MCLIPILTWWTEIHSRSRVNDDIFFDLYHVEISAENGSGSYDDSTTFQKKPKASKIGIRNQNKFNQTMLHTPTFDIDEDALKVGAGLMAYLALRELNQWSKTKS